MVPEISSAIAGIQNCPNNDGIIAEEIPLCEKSFCPVYRAMYALRALSNKLGQNNEWTYVREWSPPLSSSEESALNRIMDFVENLGLFSRLSYLRRRTIAKGVFVVNLNDFNDHGLPLSRQRVVTTFSCALPPVTTTSACSSVTVDYPYATPTYSEVLVSAQELD